MTPRQLRAAAAKERARSERLLRESIAAMTQAERLDAMADETDRLHNGPERSRMGGKMPDLATPPKRKNAKISETLSGKDPGEAKRLLIAADRTPAEIATELKVSRQTVQAWIGGQNAIPKAAADYLHKAYEIPASAWPKRQD